MWASFWGFLLQRALRKKNPLYKRDYPQYHLFREDAHDVPPASPCYSDASGCNWVPVWFSCFLYIPLQGNMKGDDELCAISSFQIFWHLDEDRHADEYSVLVWCLIQACYAHHRVRWCFLTQWKAILFNHLVSNPYRDSNNINLHIIRPY
jgi:hypothetical protein